jgi:parvulin-like peptidyl-prolyl isomerase
LATSTASSVMAQTRTPAQPNRPPAQAQPAPAAPADDRRTVDTAVKGSEIVARVGTIDVTADEVRAVIAFLDPRQQAALARDPALLSQTVRALLANRLVLKEAQAQKWEQQAAIVAQLARARENLVVETYLQSVSAPPNNFPSEAEIKAVYDANASSFLVPRRFKLAQILIAIPKDADKATEDSVRRKLDDVLKRAKQPGADFGALARAVSNEPASAERDGDIGWVAEPDLRPEIRSQIAGLAKSGISDPIRLDDGWHILQLIDTEAARVRPLAEVRDALVQRMRAERAEANRRAYVAELLKRTPPVINEIALSKVLDVKSGVPPR